MKRVSLDRMHKLIGFLAGAVALLALPATSGAAVSCSFAGSTIDIDITAGGDTFPQLGASGNNIVITNAGTPLACGGPTLTTVDTVTIDEAAGSNLNSQVNIAVPGSTGFGPGATAEPTGTSEIEFDINLGGETVQDSIGISGGDGFDHLRAGVLSPGVNGINLNPPEAGGADGDDVEMTGVESLNPSIAQLAETDQNIIDATGGPEFTGPLVAPTAVMNFSGGGGPDRLAGGDQANFLGASEGDDLVISGRGLDNADGDAGTDTISYVRATASVTMTINQVGDTGGGGFDDLATFENIVGSPFGDNLTGDGNANDVVPGPGGDTIALLGADDTFNSLDETADSIDCGAGNADSGIADPVGVDTVTGCESVNRPPETTGVSGPALTNDPSPVYGLTANEPSTFELRVDGGAFAPCAADCEVSPLADGAHQLAFRATDSTALVEQTPEAREVVVDTAAPDTQIDSGPAEGETLDNVDASFGFSSEAGATFECALDQGGFEACASPIALNGLAGGSHQFAVRAVDAAGNADQTPATRAFTVRAPDTRAPDTVITKVKVKGDDAKANFASDEPGSTFRCKLDRKPFKPCRSPRRMKNLDDGNHKLKVQSVDAAGNADPSPAKKRFGI